MAKLLIYKAAWDFDRNVGNVLLTYMAKMASAKTAFEVAEYAYTYLEDMVILLKTR